jgi:hypothetical protein
MVRDLIDPSGTLDSEGRLPNTSMHSSAIYANRA